MTIAEMQAKAAELRAKYPGQAVIVEAQACAANFTIDEAPYVDWRIHVIAEADKGLDGARFTGRDLDAIEAQISEALDPARKRWRTLAKAAKLEAEAEALRASAGGIQ
jgi:hypothetical protein